MAQYLTKKGSKRIEHVFYLSLTSKVSRFYPFNYAVRIDEKGSGKAWGAVDFADIAV